MDRAVLVSLAGAVLLSGCGTGTGRPAAAGAHSPTPGKLPATASPAPSPAPAATIPPDPQPTARAAAETFVDAWVGGNRSTAAHVATSAAVAELFSSPYGDQPVIPRGCSDTFPPYVCTFGPPGGGSGAIYQVSVLRTAAGGWYVTAVQRET